MAEPVPGDVVDTDTTAAVIALWQSAGGASLPELGTQPPQWGRLKSPAPFIHAQVACELARREAAGTGRPTPWFDHRKVSIKVWGLQPDVKAIQGILVGIFNHQTVLVYPSGARFFRWWPDGGSVLKQDDATKFGKDVWVSETVADIVSIRLQ